MSIKETLNNIFKKKSETETLEELNKKIAALNVKLESQEKISEKEEELKKLQDRMAKLKKSSVNPNVEKFKAVMSQGLKNFNDNMSGNEKKGYKPLHNPFDTLNQAQDIMEGRDPTKKKQKYKSMF